ncbi:hypothetical protein, partial [Sphingomonas sanguinis]|uniref:hypothetical protein n=1 Tax=Sphingomonas sanguinis TaxID=33051 RepID=UPI0019D35E9C
REAAKARRALFRAEARRTQRSIARGSAQSSFLNRPKKTGCKSRKSNTSAFSAPPREPNSFSSRHRGFA